MSYSDNIGTFGSDTNIPNMGDSKWLGFYNSRPNGNIRMLGNQANGNVATNGLSMDFKDGVLISISRDGVPIEEFLSEVYENDKFCGYKYTTITLKGEYSEL